MNVRVSWNGDEANRRIEIASWEALQRITVYFWSQVQLTLNVSNPRPYLNSSKPGEPPRKRTGFGAANVLYEFDRKAMASRVGVGRNAKYMAILELFRNRPWLKATLDKVLPQLRAIAEEGAQRGLTG